MLIFRKKSKNHELYVLKERFSKDFFEVYKITRFPLSIELEKIDDLEQITLDEYLKNASKYIDIENLSELRINIESNINTINQ